MQVVLRLTGYLTWYSPGGAEELTIEVPPGTTVIEAVRLAGLPFGEVAFAASDGIQRPLDDPLCPGDSVLLIPPISGG